MSNTNSTPHLTEKNAGKFSTGHTTREAIRSGAHTGPTAGLAPGYVQTNLVILPEHHASEFQDFCRNNPKPCPVIDMTAPGSPHPSADVAHDADLRFDLPRYHVYRNGEVVDEPTDIADLWQDDSVAFLLGCSFTFEEALLAAGLPIRHQECGCNVPMFRTNQPCTPTAIFQGPLVVSMRPFPAHLVDQVATLTAHYPLSHGAPVHIGDPEALGIQDLSQPDYGDPVPIHSGEVPIFWACGVTPQAIARSAHIPWMITHAPGHMFVTDQQAASQKDRKL